MAGGRIKGITIELNGDSSKLEASLKSVNKKTAEDARDTAESAQKAAEEAQAKAEADKKTAEDAQKAAKVRAYKTYKGNTVYGKYSKVKKVKVK